MPAPVLVKLTVDGLGDIYVQATQGASAESLREMKAFVTALQARGEIGPGKPWELELRDGKRCLVRRYMT